MEYEIIKALSKKFHTKEEKLKIMFDNIKEMGYDIKDFEELVEEFFEK